MKVFGIGLNKTGTRTLYKAGKILGLKAQHWTPQNFTYYRNGKMEELFSVAEEYDLLCDWPWGLVVDDLVSKFGTDTKFVLTYRMTPEHWFRSIVRHARANDSKRAREVRKAIYGSADPASNKKQYIDFYRSHVDKTKRYFRNRSMEGQILEVSWDSGHGWLQLCPFLNCDVPKNNFPHENRS